MLAIILHLKKKGKQPNKVNNNNLKEKENKEKKIPLRGFSLRRYVLAIALLRVLLTTLNDSISRLLSWITELSPSLH